MKDWKHPLKLKVIYESTFFYIYKGCGTEILFVLKKMNNLDVLARPSFRNIVKSLFLSLNFEGCFILPTNQSIKLFAITNQLR